MAAKRSSSTSSELPQRAFADARAWDAWLAAEHATARGVWMEIAKKGSGIRSVTYAEALDVALSWGWIDAQKRSLDARRFLQQFSPRGKRSIWSKVNREKIAALEAAGRMKEPGRAAVAAAKADGRWDRAYDSPARATPPPDLLSALAKSAKAQKLFAELDSANRYAILHRVATAKKPETRANRIATFVAMLARGETLHPRRKAKPSRR
jgi:uncharacterized protein YdeI (YjbR/CyaY-like superfamily)